MHKHTLKLYHVQKDQLGKARQGRSAYPRSRAYRGLQFRCNWSNPSTNQQLKKWRIVEDLAVVALGVAVAVVCHRIVFHVVAFAYEQAKISPVLSW